MTNEDTERIQRIERNIEFILEQQVRLDIKMQEVEEQQRKTESSLDRLVVQHSALEDVVLKLAQSHVELVNSHKALADSQRKLTDAQAELKDRVDAFITFVEKYISSRNGGEHRQ